jgi:hypothetical protein
MMNFLVCKNLITAFLFSIPLFGMAQNGDPSLTGTDLWKGRGDFIGITVGMGSSNFRDFATSPLIYNGVSGYLALSHFKEDFGKEVEMGISSSIGVYNSNFNDHIASSIALTFSAFYSRLYQINSLSSGKWNFKAGGMINTTGNLRFSETLMNNGLGFELIPTLFGSAKITMDISRSLERDIKLFFIKYKAKPVDRNLSLRVNPGLLNTTFRNNFIYLQHSTAIDGKVFEDYRYQLFSGLRISSAVDYTVFLKNKNTYKLSYLWDAYRTGGKFDKFEMAQHVIKFTLLYHTNNK